MNEEKKEYEPSTLDKLVPVLMGYHAIKHGSSAAETPEDRWFRNVLAIVVGGVILLIIVVGFLWLVALSW